MKKSSRPSFLGMGLLIICLILILSGCFPGDNRFQERSSAGFFWGIWHGWIAPFSLIVGFFNPAVRVYEPMNTGWWYDLGFYMAIIGGFGGLSVARKGSAKKPK